MSRLGQVSTSRFFVQLGGAAGDVGEIKYGFVAPTEAYENIADELGVTEINEDSSARGVAFGINYPKPPRVRISYKQNEAGAGSARSRGSSTLRFCDPDKLGRVLNGSLNNQELTIAGTTFEIVQVSIGS